MVNGQAVWLSSRRGTLPPESPTSAHRGLPACESSTASMRSATDTGISSQLRSI